MPNEIKPPSQPIRILQPQDPGNIRGKTIPSRPGPGAPARLLPSTSLASRILPILAGSLMLVAPAMAQEPVITPDVKYANVDDVDQDDMCVWVHPTDKSLSTIISSDKYANKIFVYSLTGTLIQSVVVGTPGNIDVRYGFSLNGETVDVVGVVGRDAQKILLYKVKSDRTLESIDDDAISTGNNYGIAMYKSPTSGKYYAFSVSESGTIKQFELTDNGSGKITGTNVRTMVLSGRTEGMVCDDETEKLYVAEENVGVWKFGAEPDAGTSKQQIAAVGTDGFVSDCEGITLYYRANGEGYIIVSSQGNSTFRILDRKAPHAFIGAFDISSASSTDGIDVCNVNLGSTYPQGVFLCHNGTSSQWGTRWETIATELGLTVDTEYWDPRGDDTSPPTPNLAAFVSAPAAISATAISMTAVTGSDPSGPIEYFFDETTGNPGGTDSEWQTSASYTDSGLDTSMLYTYTVQMRDSIQNTGTASAPLNATQADTSPPTPNTAAFVSAPAAISATAISMTAVTGSDPSGPIEYFFDETTGNPGGTDSGWQTSASYTDTGLNPSTLYAYTVQMRDNVPNTGAASSDASATTLALDTTPPTPNPATFASAPAADSLAAISMTATTGTDASGPVEYYFEEVTGNPGGTDSGWQTSTSYTDTSLTASTTYIYTVQMRDALLNTGTASAGANATPGTTVDWDNISNGGTTVVNYAESIGRMEIFGDSTLLIEAGAVITQAGSQDSYLGGASGETGSGTFIQTGGSFTHGDDLKCTDGGAATYKMQGGTSVVPGYIESDGNCLFEFSGGSFINIEDGEAVRDSGATFRVIGIGATLIQFEAIDGGYANFEFVPDIDGEITPITSGDTQGATLSVNLDLVTAPATMTLFQGGWVDPIPSVSITRGAVTLSEGTAGSLGLNEYSLDYSSATGLELSVNVTNAPLDTDGDGLLDSWELSLPGIVALTDLTGLKSGPGPGADTGDFDGDGTSDLDEFRLGLIPTDATSAFILDLSLELAGTVELSWPSQEGLQFEIYFTDDLSLPLANWSVTPPITDDDDDGAPTHEWTDEDAASHPWRFYRVGLLP